MAATTSVSPLSDRPYRLFPSARLFMFLLTLFACLIVGGGFSLFNFSLVCMVNETAISGSPISVRSSPIVASDNDQCQSINTNSKTDNEGYKGEFIWNKATQSNLLAAHAYGSLVMTIPSGLLSDRFGSKRVILVCVTINAIGSALIPTAAYAGTSWLFFVRLIQGFGSGAVWPATTSLTSVWATTSETGACLTLAAIGYQIGGFLTMLVSGTICGSSFRWPLSFYLWSGLSALFLMLWFFFYADHPNECRFIEEREKHYLEKHKLRKNQFGKNQLARIPWKQILFSPCTIAIYLCQIGYMWSMYYISEFMPTYTREVLHFNVRNNGFTSALPSLGQCLGRSIWGLLSDKLFRGRSKTFNVKVFTAICTLLPAFCFTLLGFLDCNRATLAVTSFCAASFFLASNSAGYARAGVLIAPSYAGLIGALYSACGYTAAVVMPYVVGTMAEHGTVDEWKHTAWLTAALLSVIFVQYLIFGSAEEQTWASDDNRKRPDKIYVINDKDVITCKL